MIHEYGHLIAARVLGFSAEIRSANLGATYPQIIEHLGRDLLPHEHVIFYGAGGLFTAVIFCLLCIGDRDPDNVLVNKIVAIMNLVYGAFEAWTPSRFWMLGNMAATMVAVTFTIIIIFWKKPEWII